MQDMPGRCPVKQIVLSTLLYTILYTYITISINLHRLNNICPSAFMRLAILKALGRLVYFVLIYFFGLLEKNCRLICNDIHLQFLWFHKMYIMSGPGFYWELIISTSKFRWYSSRRFNKYVSMERISLKIR